MTAQSRDSATRLARTRRPAAGSRPARWPSVRPSTGATVAAATEHSIGLTYVEPPDGFKLSFDDAAFIDVLENTFPHVLQRGIMPILLHRHGAPQVAGTAFSIMPNVALTAAHVLVENGTLRGDPASLLYVGGTYADGGLMGGPLPIWQVNLDLATDLALLRYEMPELDGAPLRVKHLPLDFRGPAVGETCVAIGYTAGFEFEEDVQGASTLSIAPKLRASKGNIEEVHLEGRDKMLPYPVFRTSAHIVEQMSGSPILSGGIGQHRVTGIVTTSYQLDEDGSTPISYGSLLSPALPLHLTFRVDGRERELSLREMIDRGGVIATPESAA